jgi:acyl-CoA synthetase (AMP-forming)/AMP-acid ligase II
MHGSQRRDRRGSTSNMNGHAHAALTQAADLADYLPPYSEDMRQAVAAAVLFKEGERATTDELIVFVRERLAPFKCPKYIVETDALPKNPNGKILKRELRDQYSDLPADLDEAEG